MVEIPSDMDRMVLCDGGHAIENAMCTQWRFDSMHPNERPNDATNIPVMSIKISRSPIATR